MGRGASITTGGTTTRRGDSGLDLTELQGLLQDWSVDGWRDRHRTANDSLRGRRVMLQVGAEILTSTDPRVDRGRKLGKATEVTVHSVLPARWDTYDDELIPAEITWAGSGGYWRTAKFDDVVELIDG